MNIYIGNLSFETTENELREAFEGFGSVSTVNIISDRMTGNPKGFAFVEMDSKDEGIEAIRGLDGKDMNGRNIKVNEAKPRPQGGGGGGRGRY